MEYTKKEIYNLIQKFVLHMDKYFYKALIEVWNNEQKMH